MYAEEARQLVEVANNASIELILKNILWRAEKGYTSLDHHTTSIPFYNSIRGQLTDLGYRVSEARVYGFHNIKVYFTIDWKLKEEFIYEEDGGTVKINEFNVPYWGFTKKEKELVQLLVYFFGKEKIFIEKNKDKIYLHTLSNKVEFIHPIFNLLPPDYFSTIETLEKFMKEQGDLQ